MKEILTNNYPLTASDIDCHKLCRLSALLGYIQNLATDHANELGIGRERMTSEYGAVWMMARLYLSLFRPIAYGDELSMRTWHRGVDKSPSVLRDFDIFVGDEHVGEAVISWVVASLDTRRLLKPASLPALVESARPARVKEVIPARIKPPDNMTHLMSRTVRYSDTDINGHMNNTKYADIACDVIRYETLANRFVSEIQINYIHESFPGDEITILCAEKDEIHYIRGTDREGLVRFDVSLKLMGFEHQRRCSF